MNYQIFKAKNQLWIRAVSALIFSETELITAEVLWNGSNQSWFSLRQRWTSLNSVSSNSRPHRILFYNFSRKLRYYAFWIIVFYCFSAETRSLHFLRTSAGKLKFYGFSEFRSHYFPIKIVLIVISQISAGKLKCYAFLNVRSHSSSAETRSFQKQRKKKIFFIGKILKPWQNYRLWKWDKTTAFKVGQKDKAADL